MLDAPNENGPIDGTDEKPLVLTGDNDKAWEILFGLQYDMFVPNPIYQLLWSLTLHLQSSCQTKAPYRRGAIAHSSYFTQVLHGEAYDGDY
jgi:hypothetical protein